MVFRFKKTYFFTFVIYKYLQVHGQRVRSQKKRYKRQNKMQIYEFTLREQNFQTLTFSSKQHRVENCKHQKLLGFNVYNIPINLFKTNVPTETTHLVYLSQMAGFYMNEIIFKMSEFCLIFLLQKFF